MKAKSVFSVVNLIGALIALSSVSAGCVLIGYDTEERQDASAGGDGQGQAGSGEADGSAADDGGGGPAGGDGGPVGDASVSDSAGEDVGDASAGDGRVDAAEQPPEPDCTSADSYCIGDKFVSCADGVERSREDCALVEGHEQQCKQGSCHPDRGCELVNAENLSECDDGLFCTVGEHCKEGVCSWGSETRCESDTTACRAASCNEEADRCDTTPANEGEPCGASATCNATGVCVGGGEACSGVECLLSCDNHANPCELNCAGALSCQATCGAGARCSVDCVGSDEICQVRCVQGSVCIVECGELSACGPIKCEAGAQCTVTCEDQEACGFSECVGSEAVWCQESSAWVCHQPCP